jgi:O-methyltransferase
MLLFKVSVSSPLNAIRHARYIPHARYNESSYQRTCMFIEKMKKRLKLSLAKRRYFLIRYTADDGHRAQWLTSAARAAADVPTLIDPWEVCNVVSALQAVRNIPGDLAEVGVAYGGSARIIAEYGGQRTLHLFDTFSGLPSPDSSDSKKFRTGDFESDVSLVQKRLHGFPVCFHVGMFPETAGPVADKQFSFVHLDMDLYQGTLDALEFFYPRMAPGGIILSHDYGSAVGVMRAFSEFFASRPDPVIELIRYS